MVVGMSHDRLRSERVGGEFGDGHPLVVIEPDFMSGDIEDELPVCAFIELPSAVGFAQGIVDEMLDCLGQGHRAGFRRALSPDNRDNADRLVG